MKRQEGLTLISILMILAVLLFNGVIALNVLPVYITDHSVKTLLKNMETDSSIRGKTPKMLKKAITKGLRVNNVYTVSKEHISVKKGQRDYVITIEYEPRGKLMGNLDYIVSFKHEARIPAT